MPAAVLLIEDDEDSRELLSELLHLRGFAVTAVGSFHEAVGSLERHAYDLVLSDFFVASQDVAASWQMLRRVKELAQPARVILLTAYPVTQEECERLGFSFLLKKPCAADDLFGQLADALALPPITSAHEALVRTYFAALQRGDYDSLVALCVASVVYHLPRAPLPMSDRVVGRAAFRELSQRTFEQFREPIFEVTRIRSLPSGAIVRYTGSWLDANGVRCDLPGDVLFSFSENEIAEIGVRCDLSVID